MTESKEKPAYRGRKEGLPIGVTYGEVEYAGRTVREGDIVAFDDPEMTEHDFERRCHSRLLIGIVEEILQPEHGEEPQLITTIPRGRLDFTDANVSGEGSRIPKQSGQQKFVEQFLNSDYEKYMICEWGENIGETGDDFVRRGE